MLLTSPSDACRLLKAASALSQKPVRSLAMSLLFTESGLMRVVSAFLASRGRCYERTEGDMEDLDVGGGGGKVAGYGGCIAIFKAALFAYALKVASSIMGY